MKSNLLVRIKKSLNFLLSRRSTRAILVVLVIPVLALISSISSYTVTTTYQAGEEGYAELFYAAKGQEFEPERSVLLAQTSDALVRKATFKLHGVDELERIRLDLTNHPGALKVREVLVVGPAGQAKWTGESLSQVATKNVLTRSPSSSGVIYEALDYDPQWFFDVPISVSKWSWRQWLSQLALTTWWCVLVWAIFEALGIWLTHHKSMFCAFWQRIDMWCKAISDSNTIVFRASSFMVILGMLLGAILFVSLKLHQSSIGRWDVMYGLETVERSVSFGTPKAIRSDEWNTQTPWILNQVQRGQSITNTNVGGAESAFVAALPSKGMANWLQPKFWGFEFFDIERGFSVIWAYKAFGLLSSFFLLLLFLTRGQVLLSLGGALWVCGSSYVQWWYSSNLPEILIGFALGVTGALYLLRAKRTGGMWFGGVLIVFSVSTLLLHVYPPFLIPLAYLGAFICIGVLCETGLTEADKGCRLKRLAVAALSTLLVVIVVASWGMIAQETISLMTQTVYPGRRHHLGGAMPLDRLFYGFFEAMRVREGEYPLPPSNASEASSFLLLFPLLFLLVKPLDWRRSENRLGLALLCYCVFLLAWMALPLPLTVREIIAKLGWSLTSSHRAEIGLGIGSILAVVVSMSRFSVAKLDTAKKFSKGWPYIVLGISALVVISWGLYLREEDPSFFYIKRIALGTALTMAVVVPIVMRVPWLFVCAILLFCAPSLTVNPVQSGLESIFEKPVLKLAYSYGRATDDRWAVIGDYVFAQGLKARGLDVFGGSNFAPNMSWIKTLDPEKLYANVWNRYAHIMIVSDPATRYPVFELKSPDSYAISINVCQSDVVKALGINMLAYTGVVPSEDLACLQPLPSDTKSGVKFYKLIDTANHRD